MRIVACQWDQHEQARWRLTVAYNVAGSLNLDLENAGADQRTSLAIDGLPADELLQVVAVKAAELLRPAVDELLVKLRLLEATQNSLDSALASLEAASTTTADVDTATVSVGDEGAVVAVIPGAAVWRVGLRAGPTFGLEQRRLSEQASLQVGWRQRALLLGLEAGVAELTKRDREGVRLVSGTARVGVSVALLVDDVGLAAYGALRRTVAKVDSKRFEVRDQRLSLTDVEMGARASWLGGHLGEWLVGGDVECAYVWYAHTLDLFGTPILQASRLNLGLTMVVARPF